MIKDDIEVTYLFGKKLDKPIKIALGSKTTVENKKYRCKAWINEEFNFTVHAPSREEARNLCDEILETKRKEIDISRMLIEVRNDVKE